MADNRLKETTETVRIPLYLAEEQRIHSARNIAGSEYYGGMDQSLVNCFPVLYKDPLRPDQPSTKLVSRLGFTAVEDAVDISAVVNDPDTVEVRAALSFSSLIDVAVVAYFDHSNSHIYIVQHRPVANTCVRIADITPSGYTGTIQVFLTELTISNTPNLGVVLSGTGIGDKSQGFYNAINTTTKIFDGTGWTEITDTDFPPKQTPARKITGPMVQMDGYTFVLTEDGAIYNSTLNSISTWETDGFVNAASRPDRGVTLVRYKHHLMAFGDSTIEFFNNEGIAPPASPLERTNQAFLSLGAIGPKAVINIDDTIYWLAKSATGAIGLWKLDGYTPVLVTQPYHSYVTQTFGADPNLQVLTMHGMRHLITNIVYNHQIGWLPSSTSGDITPDNGTLKGYLTYCIDTNAWWLMSFELSGVYGQVHTSRTNPSTGGGLQRTYIWFGIGARDNVSDNYGAHPVYVEDRSELSPTAVSYDVFRDGNATALLYWRIPVGIFTNVLDFGQEKRKFIRNVRLIGDQIEWLTGTTPSTPYDAFSAEAFRLYFAYTKSENARSNPSEWVIRYTDVPAIADTDNYLNEKRYYWNQLGTGRHWKFALLISTWVPLRFEALEVTVSQGIH